jgi:hypothetical protein
MRKFSAKWVPNVSMLFRHMIECFLHKPLWILARIFERSPIVDGIWIQEMEIVVSYIQRRHQARRWCLSSGAKIEFYLDNT